MTLLIGFGLPFFITVAESQAGRLWHFSIWSTIAFDTLWFRTSRLCSWSRVFKSLPTKCHWRRHFVVRNVWFYLHCFCIALVCEKKRKLRNVHPLYKCEGLMHIGHFRLFYIATSRIHWLLFTTSIPTLLQFEYLCTADGGLDQSYKAGRYHRHTIA